MIDEHYIIIDECDLVLGKNYIEKRVGQPLLVDAFQRGRAFLETIIAATNNVSDIVDAVVANTSIKFAMRMTDEKNLYAMGKATKLSRKQYEEYKKLKKHEAIISEEKNYIVKLNPFPLPLIPISDEEVNKRTKTILRKYHIKKESLCKQNLKADEKSNDELDETEKNFVWEIYLRQLSLKTDHYKNLKLTSDKGNRITNRLKQKAIIEELKINVGGKQKNVTFLILTNKGYIAIGKPLPLIPGRGEGIIHHIKTEYLKSELQKDGFKVESNYKLRNKEVDLALILSDGSKIAIEISEKTTATHEVNQAIKNLEVGFSHVIILANETKIPRIKEILESKSTLNIIVSKYSINHKKYLKMGGD